MQAHFRFRVPVRPQDPLPPAPPLSAGPEPPLLALLRELRGHQVTVVAGGREITGKLVQPDPVTLVGTAGMVTVIPLDRVISVAY